MSDIQKPTLLILAAGMGSRYGGLKQLDGVGPNKETIIEYSIHDAIRAGFGKVVCVIRETFAEEFKERIFKPFEGMIELATVFQDHDAFVPGDVHMKREKPWGTGHAILCASQEVNTPFAVINADDFYGRESFQKMSEFLRFHCSETHYGMFAHGLEKSIFIDRADTPGYGPIR
jgi:choline kinase